MTARRVVKATTRSPSDAIKEDEDPRVAKLTEAFRANSKLAPVIDAFEREKAEGGRKFGSNGLKANGKLFALFTQGTLIVKLPKERRPPATSRKSLDAQVASG